MLTATERVQQIPSCLVVVDTPRRESKQLRKRFHLCKLRLRSDAVLLQAEGLFQMFCALEELFVGGFCYGVKSDFDHSA